MKDDETAGDCSMDGRDEKCVKILMWLPETEELASLYRRVVLNWIFIHPFIQSFNRSFLLFSIL